MSAVYDQEQEVPIVLSDEDIDALNRARTVLADLSGRCSTQSWRAGMNSMSDRPTAADYGRVEALARRTEDEIFSVLNWANSHHVRRLTDEQLHNRAAAEIDELQQRADEIHKGDLAQDVNEGVVH